MLLRGNVAGWDAAGRVIGHPAGADNARDWQRSTGLTPRKRKLVGAVVLLVFLALYALAALAVAVVLQVNASRFTELAYYIVAGLVWVIPAGLIIKWMEAGRAGS